MNGKWKHMAGRITGIAVILLCLGQAACLPRNEGAMNRDGAQTEDAALTDTEQPQTADGQETEEGTGSLETGQESRRLTGEAAVLLSEEQEKLLLEYMDTAFGSIARLEMDGKLAELFEEPSGPDAWMNEKGLEYLIGIRRLQETDLTLADYAYELSVLEVMEEGNEVEVVAEEWNRQNFMQHPQADSEQFGIRHRFVLVRKGGGWKVREHLQQDGIYWQLLGEYWGEDIEEIPDAKNYLQERVDILLKETKEQLGTWKEGKQTELPSFEHAYDRKQAVSYAREWVGRRNGEWLDYSRYGGNCQNYASQCLLAGGIPMDRDGNAVWKWYGDQLDQGGSTAGRSSSWTGVDEFYQYAAQNEGFGLAAAVDFMYEEGEEGDLIRMGFPGDWNHVVVITDVVKDEEGRTVDYLIGSNTSDMRDFPVSAYPLPCRSLIKIAGWNGTSEDADAVTIQPEAES